MQHFNTRRHKRKWRPPDPRLLAGRPRATWWRRAGKGGLTCSSKPPWYTADPFERPGCGYIKLQKKKEWAREHLGDFLDKVFLWPFIFFSLFFSFWELFELFFLLSFWECCGKGWGLEFSSAILCVTGSFLYLVNSIIKIKIRRGKNTFFLHTQSLFWSMKIM